METTAFSADGAVHMMPNDLKDRLAVLEAYDIMDSPPEEMFDDITRLASYICATPIALITLLDASRQWFKSKVGLQPDSTPIEQAFCAHAIAQKDVLIVRDASLDARFSANPLVTSDPNIRFYAGAQLVTPDGVALGTLCAIDHVPRELWPEQISALQALARQVVHMLELRKAISDLKAARAAKEDAERKVGMLESMIPLCSWCRKIRCDDDSWQTIETYIERNSTSRVTHGICPTCVEVAMSNPA